MEGLSDRQRELLAFIIEYKKEKGIAPSLTDMAVGLKLRSVSPIQQFLKALQVKGYIDRVKGQAGLKILRDQGGNPYAETHLAEQPDSEAAECVSLTEFQSSLLKFIGSYTQENQRSPTFREIAKGLHQKSLVRIDLALHELKELGIIDWTTNRARSIRILKKINL